MEFLAGFLTVAFVALLGAISPGPDMAVVMKNSILKSRKDGLMTATGVVVGIVLYESLALFGLAAIIAQSFVIFSIIKYCGAAYLIYLGFRLLTSKTSHAPQAGNTPLPGSLKQSFKEGLVTNLSNPKFMIFLLALFTQVIDPHTPLMVQIVYASALPLIAFAWFSTLALVLTTERVRTRFSRFLSGVEKVMGAVLIALGVRVATSHS